MAAEAHLVVERLKEGPEAGGGGKGARGVEALGEERCSWPP